MCHLFLYCPLAKNGFYVFKWWGGGGWDRGRRMMSPFYEIQISLFFKVSLGTGPLVFVYCGLWLLWCWAVLTGIVWLTKPKIFTAGCLLAQSTPLAFAQCRHRPACCHACLLEAAFTYDLKKKSSLMHNSVSFDKCDNHVITIKINTEYFHYYKICLMSQQLISFPGPSHHWFALYDWKMSDTYAIAKAMWRYRMELHSVSLLEVLRMQ